MTKHLMAEVQNKLNLLGNIARLAIAENAELRDQLAKLKSKLLGDFAHTKRELNRRIYMLGKVAAEYLDMQGWTERTITLDDGRNFTIKIAEAPKPENEEE